LHQEHTYDLAKRKLKAEKIIEVLHDHSGTLPGTAKLLDIGCSIGVATHMAGESVGLAVGIDIDCEAIRYAKRHYSSSNARYLLSDSMELPFKDNSIDAAICSHVYEHVPDADRMMDEIFRVLVPGGICYFAGGNLLQVVEPHYRIPFLSILPRHLAGLILKLTGKGTAYYEKHRTLDGLIRLTGKFMVRDYTVRIVEDPVRYGSTDMVRPGSFYQKVSLFVLRHFYWICPTYIWILEKPAPEKD